MITLDHLLFELVCDLDCGVANHLVSFAGGSDNTFIVILSVLIFYYEAFFELFLRFFFFCDFFYHLNAQCSSLVWCNCAMLHFAFILSPTPCLSMIGDILTHLSLVCVGDSNFQSLEIVSFLPRKSLSTVSPQHLCRHSKITGIDKLPCPKLSSYE